MMPDAAEKRKKLFKASLALAGLSAKEWAEEDGISYQHLYFVLNGERQSPRLTAKIDAFIGEHARQVA